jgi:ParB family chromosome partitioning protein
MPSHFVEAEERLSRHFGTKVLIKTNERNKKGKIEIEYYNSEDLARIMEILADDAQGHAF